MLFYLFQGEVPRSQDQNIILQAQNLPKQPILSKKLFQLPIYLHTYLINIKVLHLNYNYNNNNYNNNNNNNS